MIPDMPAKCWKSRRTSRKIKHLFFLCWLGSLCVYAQNPDWQTAKQAGEAKITVLYSPNHPFVFQDAQKEIRGIEAALIRAFADYLKREEGVQLRFEWEEVGGLARIRAALRLPNQHNWGISGLSITPERKQQFLFTPAYMPDIEVLVSHRSVPIFQDSLELINSIEELDWVTVPGSTLERNLNRLASRYQLGQRVYHYEGDPDAVAAYVSKHKNTLAYLQLPTYISALQNEQELSRQVFFSVQNEGLAIALGAGTDWYIPWRRFFEQKTTQKLLHDLIRDYMSSESTLLIEQLQGSNTSQNRLEILEAERRIRDLQLAQKTLLLERQRWLILSAGLALLVVLLTLFFFVRSNRSRKRIQEKLSQKNAALVQLNQEKNYLMGILAHDLRNPLTSALSLTQLAEDESLDQEDRQEVSQKLRSILERMNEMINRMLDVRGIETQESRLRLEEVPLHRVLEEVVLEHRPYAAKKNITIGTRLYPLTLRADQDYWRQIADNLLSNAIKFSPSGAQVDLSLSEQNGVIRFEVRDEGKGVPPEELPRLFLPYETLSTRPTAGEASTGLGLSIVRRYVEALGGRVWCESDPETRPGSTFIVTLFRENRP